MTEVYCELDVVFASVEWNPFHRRVGTATVRTSGFVILNHGSDLDRDVKRIRDFERDIDEQNTE